MDLFPLDPAVQLEKSSVVSFSRLNGLVNRIAAGLPVPPGSIVPVCLDPSVELIASIIGILQCGATYVILDPTGSVERNRYIIEEVNACLVVTDKKYSGFFSQPILVSTLLEEDPSLARRKDARYNPPHVDPATPAYIIYPSGSTGKPKGVTISHAAASLGISHFSLNGNRRWLLIFNPIFSAAQRTILATLCKGGCLCLASKDRLSTSLHDVIENMKVDGIGITPSMLATLPPSNTSTSLKQITTVGESLSAAILDAWAKKVHLRSSYGLSEFAQLNFSRRLQQGDPPNLVGKPCDTTSAYVLFPDSTEIAPVGADGELCLVGPQLSDGYINQPSESAKSFVNNPFGTGRMFRTGDLARQHSDGTFEILGRLDRQIKLQGQRLEPDEVSAVLHKHKGVVITAVVAADVNNIKALVAAVVPCQDQEWTQLVSELRQIAQQCLPAFMVPNYWIKFEHLPTNSNGKVHIRQIQARAEITSPQDMLGRSRPSTWTR